MEDDAKGAGHNKANKKYIIKTLPAIVKNGKADADFLLFPSSEKIATRNGKDEDKIQKKSLLP